MDGQSTADVMLRNPKTLPGSASVADVRALLADHTSVQMVLLADGGTFRGAITELPDDAADTAPALDYADRAPATLAPTASAAEAFAAAAGLPHRRVVVLDEGGALLGLVCLDQTRTRFCGGGKS
jgi:CBS domain-containing protein